MPWICGICGKNGDRQDANSEAKTRNEYWCYRGALGSLRQQGAKCCNCALYHGDFTPQGYAGSGCDNCLNSCSLSREHVERIRRGRGVRHLRDLQMLANLAAKSNKPAAAQSGPGACHTHRRPKEVSDKQSGALKLKVFMFDNCLFRTPEKPKWWPFRSYEPMIESVCPPHVDQIPGDEFWNMDVVEEVKNAMQDSTTWTVLLTFRTDAFQKRLTQMVAYMGLKFDEIRCRPVCAVCSPLGLTSTGAAGYSSLRKNIASPAEAPRDVHNMVVIGDILNYCKMVTELEIWTSSFSISPVILRSNDYLSVRVHPVRGLTPHPGGTPSPEFLSKINNWYEDVLINKAREVKPTSARKAVTAGPKLPRRRGKKPSARPTLPTAKPNGNSMTDPWSSDCFIFESSFPSGSRRFGSRWAFQRAFPTRKCHPNRSAVQGFAAANFYDDPLDTVYEWESDDYENDDSDQQHQESAYEYATGADEEELEEEILNFVKQQSLLSESGCGETACWDIEDQQSMSSFSEISEVRSTSDWDELEDFEVRSVASVDCGSEISQKPCDDLVKDGENRAPISGYLAALLMCRSPETEAQPAVCHLPTNRMAVIEKTAMVKGSWAEQDGDPDVENLWEEVRGVKGRKTKALRVSKKGRSRH